MAYEKQNFQDGDVLTAENLNRIEDALVAVEEQVGTVETALDGIIAIQNGLIGGDGV